MTPRRLAALQWVGLFGGAVVWAAQHALGFGLTQAQCGDGGRRWGLGYTAFQATTTAVSGLLILGALAASALAFVGTGDTAYDAEPPGSRIRFFAIAALPVNVLMLMIVLLDGIASLVDPLCRQG